MFACRGALAGTATIPTLLVHEKRFLAIEPDPTPKNPNNMKNVLSEQKLTNQQVKALIELESTKD